MKAFIPFFIFVFLSQSGLAFEVIKIKNNKALIKLQNEVFQEGEVVSVVDQNDAAVAMIEIKKNKNNQAIVEIKKGLLAEKVEYKISNPKNGSALINQKEKKTKKSNRLSFALAANSNDVQVNLTSSSSISMTGRSYGTVLKYDRPFFKNFGLQIGAGLNQIKGEGQINSIGVCSNSVCQVEILNLDLSGLVMMSLNHFSVSTSEVSTWLGAGLALTYPITKTSNIIDVNTIGLSQKIILDAGLNWNLSSNQFIPFRIEYSFAVNKTTVSMSQLAVQIGYGFEF